MGLVGCASVNFWPSTAGSGYVPQNHSSGRRALVCVQNAAKIGTSTKSQTHGRTYTSLQFRRREKGMYGFELATLGYEGGYRMQ